ncbi:hypothetical protein OESDEN_12527 [Oesophagostomum dentatum]|uniref:Uncharacterized protein n=1 Tax=Oesophagostomum dentatum TaxID=61180 RepID=A0A0B1SW15_OESDE|nr:hypothetical protein OESDEN_12527 [Oesophagostomum dentatum]
MVYPRRVWDAWMKPLVALLTVLTYGAAKLCVIKTAKDLDAADSCTSLILDGDDGVMQSPQLFGHTLLATLLRNSSFDMYRFLAGQLSLAEMTRP